MSLPTPKAMFDLCPVNSSFSISSLSITGEFSLLGTSIPTAGLPGIGASILMSAAARLSLISSDSAVILDTLTPCSGIISYLVTAGPQLTLVTFTFTPKLFKVSWSSFAVLFNSSSSAPLPFTGSANKSSGGTM